MAWKRSTPCWLHKVRYDNSFKYSPLLNLSIFQGFMPADDARLLGSINVTENECQFDGLAPGGLKISR